ncbi:MAG: cysteine desulfurase NifS [Kiritimatiellae bacterium]|jgi:cysteine desulfurase|nr:cysteine desulfurase NifS [Kiritimatiellia bacterium]
MKNYYFDNNATSAVAPEVTEVMLPFFTKYWGNPSSIHEFGGQVGKYVRNARAQVADLINADPSEIVFTSCGTESDNAAIRGAVEAANCNVNLITSCVEHLAVLSLCRYLSAKEKISLAEIAVDGKGNLNLDEFKRELAKGPAVVSLMWANNETGVFFPIQKIAEMVKEAGSIMHTDAVQAIGKIEVDVQKTPVDLLALSGHKLHAPKGIGAMYVRKGTKLNSLLIGGHQEKNRRGGTENVPYIVGLGKACELAKAGIEDERTRVAALRDRLEAGILASCPDTTVNGDVNNRLPNTTNISFKYIEGESILYNLSDLGIAASSGSACTSGSLETSHVIRAMGIPFTSAHGSIRFSLSRYNESEDVEHVIANMPAIVERLREMSPFVD